MNDLSASHIRAARHAAGRITLATAIGERAASARKALTALALVPALPLPADCIAVEVREVMIAPAGLPLPKPRRRGAA
jgi:hypothetical protein